jgi:hypothetical protein
LDAQNELLESQQSQMEVQNQKLQMQEQRLQRQELRMQRQEEQLRQQELQLGQQDQQLEQMEHQIHEQQQILDTQAQQLKEQGQDTEQQERRALQNEEIASQHGARLDQQKAMLNELFLANKAAMQQQQSNSTASGGRGEAVSEASWDDTGSPPERHHRPVSDAEVLAQPNGAITPGERPVHGAVPLTRNGPASASSAVASSNLLGPSAFAQAVASRDGLLHASGIPGRKSGNTGVALWEKVLELCDAQKFLEAYKLVIAEPEESCLLRLMHHTGPIVERLDAESNSRLIRRLIHILSSPSKESATSSIDQIFSWLWQALDVGIHFTSSQVEDLATALQKVAAPQSSLPSTERAEASRLLSRLSSLRRS